MFISSTSSLILSSIYRHCYTPSKGTKSSHALSFIPSTRWGFSLLFSVRFGEVLLLCGNIAEDSFSSPFFTSHLSSLRVVSFCPRIVFDSLMYILHTAESKERPRVKWKNYIYISTIHGTMYELWGFIYTYRKSWWDEISEPVNNSETHMADVESLERLFQARDLLSIYYSVTKEFDLKWFTRTLPRDLAAWQSESYIFTVNTQS